MKNNRRSNSLKLAAAAFVFGGFPIVGMVFFWNDMHRKIEADAALAIEVAWSDLSKGGYEKFKKWATKQAGEALSKAEFDRQMQLAGKGPISWKAVKSNARERGDLMWQFAYFEGKGESASIKLTLGRLYLGRPDTDLPKGKTSFGEGLERNWYVDSLIVAPLAGGAEAPKNP